MAAEPISLRFTMSGDGPPPSAEEMLAALGETVTDVAPVEGSDAYEVSFEPQSDDEADAIWLMICEIGRRFPGAVLTD